jgi:2'-5' RNA ligase
MLLSGVRLFVSLLGETAWKRRSTLPSIWVMSESFPAPAFSEPPKPTDNVFLGLFPADTSRIAELARLLRGRHGLLGRPLATDRFHMTLFCFDVRVDLRAVNQACALAADTTRPFEVELDRVLSFTGRPGNRPLVLRGSDDNAALMSLFERLSAALVESRFSFKRKLRFNPHVTLLYDERSIPEESVEPIRWTVSEFVLVHSLVGRSRYIPLARWTFRG